MASLTKNKGEAAVKFTRQAEKLSLKPRSHGEEDTERTTAVGAHFITPLDPVIETASGDRLPAVPLIEAEKLNRLKEEISSDNFRNDLSPGSHQGDREQHNELKAKETIREDKEKQGGEQGQRANDETSPSSSTITQEKSGFGKTEAPLESSVPPSRTNPLFPPLPLYGPPSLLRTIQCTFFRFTSFFLSLGFLGSIVVGSAVTSLPLMCRHIGLRLTLRDPDTRRPFNDEEKRRKKARKEAERAWKKDKRRRRKSLAQASESQQPREEDAGGYAEEFVPTEGGRDRLVCDAGYYARRVGLDMEEFEVQTEDGYIITLWHVFDPREYARASPAELAASSKPEVFFAPSSTTAFPSSSSPSSNPSAPSDPNSTNPPLTPTTSPCHRRRHPTHRNAPPRYPVLLMHGLLQSAGAYCVNDDSSLAFFLAKSGYDVWLGNNRCGFNPRHTLLPYSDPRLWAFNIRQMGVLDLPALVARVLAETGFPKLGLVCHSQGTTETFVALAKEQRPELGRRVSVFCALAPAVYAGPLIEKMYFRFMRVISPGMFRVVFGIHAFIPFMMTMHRVLPRRLYGAMGYRVFSFLFGWTDERWERDLRDRMFMFAPVYVSAESMRWWLGRECFAKHKCILATREASRREDAEDYEEDHAESPEEEGEKKKKKKEEVKRNDEDRGSLAWYDENAPPMALWIAGSDELVDGRRLLRRFDRGREPHVNIVHSKIIPEYEHLDVLWAMDAIDKVGKEVRDVIWRTATDKEGCAVPKGCETLVG